VDKEDVGRDSETRPKVDRRNFGLLSPVPYSSFEDRDFFEPASRLDRGDAPLPEFTKELVIMKGELVVDDEEESCWR